MDAHVDRRQNRPPRPERSSRRERSGRPWWVTGLAVLAFAAVMQDHGTVVHLIAGSLLPALAGCAWVLASSDWSS